MGLPKKIFKYATAKRARVISLREPSPYKVVSLFTGAMGLDIGFLEAGFDISVCQENDPWCLKTIINNDHRVVPGDIRKLIRDDPTCQFLLQAGKLKKKEITAVIGGPPCQPFSTAGKRRGALDERSLIEEFMHVVERLEPRFFLMENVKGVVSMPSISDDKHSPPLIQTILEKFKDIGYRVVAGVLDAVNYGAPQFRERLVILGTRDNEQIYLPAPTHFQLHQEPAMRWRTLFDAISDLENHPGLCAKFSSRIQKMIELVPEGGNWRSLPENLIREAMGGAFESGGGKVGFFRRLRYGEPSPTLVTSPIQKATILCHPRANRPLSVLEYARIQGFPDAWAMKGQPTALYRQIGNAVSIPLAKALGAALLSVIEGNSEIKVKRTRGTSAHNAMLSKQATLKGQV